MSHSEFLAQHSRFLSLMSLYFGEARKTADLLAGGASKPLCFRRRFAILRQQTVENTARDVYVGAKLDLYRVARDGYDGDAILPPA
jgi:hypothetical protein